MTYSDDSYDSGQKQIKAMRLIFFENVFFEKVILKMFFFEGEISKKKLRERESYFKNVFLKRAIFYIVLR